MIALESISFGYHQKPVIQELSLTFPQGEITGLIGKNGCGKTTLLKLAAGLLEPWQGKVLLDNQPLSTLTDRQRACRIGVLPQCRDSLSLTAWQMVLHGRYPHLGFSRVLRPRDREVAERAMKRLGIWDYRHRLITELSGGQRQRVYLAMVLAQESDYIFFDEASTHLDLEQQFALLELFQQLKAEGKSLICVMHDLEQALHSMDRLCLLDQGQISFFGRPRELLESGQIEKVFRVRCQQLQEGQEEFFVFRPDKTTGCNG